MLIRKGDEIKQRWNGHNNFGNTETTPRHERMNATNKIPDELIVRHKNGMFYLELDTGELYQFPNSHKGLKDTFNTMARHLTYNGSYANIDKKTVETRVYQEIDSEKVWVE